MICFHKWKYEEKYSIEKRYYITPVSDPIKYLEYRQDKKCVKCGKIKTKKILAKK